MPSSFLLVIIIMFTNKKTSENKINIFNIQKYSTKQRGTNEERVKYMYNNNDNVNRITLFADKPFPCSLALD